MKEKYQYRKEWGAKRKRWQYERSDREYTTGSYIKMRSKYYKKLGKPRSIRGNESIYK